MESKGFMRIKDKIIEEAEEKAKAMNAEAESQAKEYEESKAKEVGSYKESEAEKIDREKQLLEDRMLAQARLNSQKKFLTAREKLINDIIDEAVSSVKRDAQYKSFMKKILDTHRSVLKEPLKVMVNSADVDTTKQLLDKAGLNGEVQKTDITGGMIIEDSEGKRIKESLASRLEMSKDEIRIKIANLLGGKG
jgi:V/A-type H+-transporting ATPase subunit E